MVKKISLKYFPLIQTMEKICVFLVEIASSVPNIDSYVVELKCASNHHNIYEYNLTNIFYVVQKL